MNETATLAKYAVDLRYEDIPEKVLERVRNMICDTVGAILFGYGLPWSQMIVDYAAKYGQGARAVFLAPVARWFSHRWRRLRMERWRMHLSSTVLRNRAPERIHAPRYSLQLLPFLRSAGSAAEISSPPPDRDDVYEKFSVLTRDCSRQRVDEIFRRLQLIEAEKNFDWLMV